MPVLSYRLIALSCALAISLLSSSGCGGGGGGGGNGAVAAPPATVTPPATVAPAATFTVGGTVSGLGGDAQLALALNGGAPLLVSASGSFKFAMPVTANGNYAVTIVSQPAMQSCTVTNGSGAISADVTNVAVSCTANPPVVTLTTVAGTITGMLPGTTLALANLGNAPVTYGGSGSFAFPAIQGQPYSLSVAQNPAGQWCTVTGGAGVATAATTPVMVTCRAAQLALLAGFGGGLGSSDGTGTSARFNRPMGMVMDSLGNLFVADDGNSVIRKITPAGVVTTFAGVAGASGNVDGAGAAARFGAPTGIAIDHNDNLYVVNAATNSLRHITPAGVVTTLADKPTLTGIPDSATGPFYPSLSGIALDAAGNQYVADMNLHIIRKRTAAGSVTTFAGQTGVCGHADGAASVATLCGPTGLAIDPAGTVYVIDGANQLVRTISPAGVVATLAGTPTQSGGRDGPGATALFGFDNSVATDGLFPAMGGIVVEAAGSVLVTDYYNGRVRRIAIDGTVTTAAGLGEGYIDGPAASARFRKPTGIALSADGQILLAEDTGDIRKIAGGIVSTFAGRPMIGDLVDGQGAAAQFRQPTGLAVDSAGNVFVADFNNNVVRKITPAGVTTTFAGLAGTIGLVDGVGSAARFANPYGIAIDKTDNLYVTDRANVRKITPDGVVTTVAGAAFDTGYADGVGTAARFSFPEGIAVDDNGVLFVADTFNRAIRKITPDGTVSTIARSGCDYADGVNGRFCTIAGIAVDHAGNVYFSDNNIGNIRKLTPQGVMSLVAGNNIPYQSLPGSTDGFGNAARFRSPDSIALDSMGNIYVADTTNATVRLVTPAGAVSTLVGVAGRSEVHEGALPALLSNPAAVAVGPGDRLYIISADSVLKVSPF